MKSHHSSSTQRNLQLRGRAAGMREAGTASERALWQLLRGGQLGVAFRRQVVLHGCIVDFVALNPKLVVEVDGAYHSTPEQRRADARRDRRLAKVGYRVLRVAAAEVLARPEQVRVLVSAALAW